MDGTIKEVIEKYGIEIKVFLLCWVARLAVRKVDSTVALTVGGKVEKKVVLRADEWAAMMVALLVVMKVAQMVALMVVR